MFIPFHGSHSGNTSTPLLRHICLPGGTPMSTSKNRLSLSTRVVVSIVAGVLALLAALAGVMGARRTSAPPVMVFPKVVKRAPAPSLPQRTRPIADFESELITITPHGFEPREITRPLGPFLLMVDNRSGVAATALALTSEAGQRACEMRVPREEPNWSDVVNLLPGHYVLTEADHPRWSCRITITAQ